MMTQEELEKIWEMFSLEIKTYRKHGRVVFKNWNGCQSFTSQSLSKYSTSDIEYGALKGAILNKKEVIFSRNTWDNYNPCYYYVSSAKNITLENGRTSYEEGIIETYFRLPQIL